MDLKIKAVSEIPFNHRCLIVEQYCKEFQSYKNERNPFSGLNDRIFSMVEHKKYPARIKLKNSYQEYWVKCYKTKTSYVFDIWYA